MDLSCILGGLNAAQAAAVTADAPVVQVLAPPGSGKTKTLTSRVAYLLRHHGYQPWNTLCLTFTIKSAREMRERIARMMGDGVESKLILGTFHSVCRRYLVTYGHLIGIKKGFGIADSTDSLNIIKRLTKRLKATQEPAKLRARISSSKARRTGYEELRAEAARSRSKVDQQEFLQIFQEYEAHLAISNLLDYDDLLLRCVDLLQAHPECVSNVEAVLIDEFQDTNSVQFDLMRLFASQNKRITTVGDPDQSIYGWRSAEIKNLTKMQRLYPDTLVLNLESNYRSSAAILSAALEVIEQDTARPSKPLLPTHCRGTSPVLRKLPSSYAEASWIVSEIKRAMTLTGGGLLNFSDFAILLRSAALSRQIESAFGRAGFPYRMVGGARFFDRAEIKVLLNYLRVIASPNNGEALSAIINVPPRRIGESTVKALLEEARTQNVTLFTLVRNFSQGTASLTTKLTKQAEQGLGALLNILLTARKKLSDEEAFYPAEVLGFVLKRLEFKEYLARVYPEEEDTRWSNVEELAAQAADPAFGMNPEKDEENLPSIENVAQEQPANPAEDALNKFLSNVALSTELQTDDDDSPQHRITISTIHAAKGLEWPVVFIPSAYHGSIPHSRAEDNDEERRLLYVAMTRAQAMLYISFPLRNSTSGDETSESPFLIGKDIRRQFVDLGPSLYSDSIAQIAQILGRACPTEEAINAGLNQAEHIEDELWTAEGEENRGLRFDKDVHINPAAKRRRLDKEGSMPQNGSVAGMPVSEAATKAGFAPVSTHFSSVRLETGSFSAPTKPIAIPKKVGNNQGTLSSLWGRNTPRIEASASPLGSAHVTVQPLAPRSNNFGIQKTTQGLVGGSSFSMTAQSYTLPGKTHSVSRLGSARPKAAPSPSTAAYVFLSSSPPPEPEAAATAAQTKTSLKPEVLPAERQTSLHNTSMDQLQAGGGGKRSLGVRRSLTGWQNYQPRPFSVPRRNGQI